MSSFSSSQRTRLPFHHVSRMSGSPSSSTSMRTMSLGSGLALLSLDLRGELGSCSCTEYFCVPGLVVASGSEGGRTQSGVVAGGAARTIAAVRRATQRARYIPDLQSCPSVERGYRNWLTENGGRGYGCDDPILAPVCAI